MQIEICCGDILSVITAKKGGASRIELCCSLSEGGVTPSSGLIKAAVKSGIPMINVLIRPRGGDFLYNRHEISLMQEDIRMAIESGATGIVTGILNSDGDIDEEIMSLLIKTARDIRPETNITFHRAFDMVRNPEESLEQIISLGCDTLLTSGLSPSALQGIRMLRDLNEKSGGRILIMAGGGINPQNASYIIETTGIGALHASAREIQPSRMKFKRKNVSMGNEGYDEYSLLTTSENIVKKLIDLIH